MRRFPCFAGVSSVSLFLLAVPTGSDAIAPAPVRAAPVPAAPAPKIDCIFTADKSTYEIGQVPFLTVRLINNTGEEVTLLRPLDGSGYGRYPVYRVRMRDAAGKLVEEPVGLCGTLNPLEPKDFIRIPAGQAYAPFGDDASSSYELGRFPVKKPGVYTVRFYYSSASSEIWRYMSFERTTQKPPVGEIMRLFERVPKFEVLRELKLTFTAKAAETSRTGGSPAD